MSGATRPVKALAASRGRSRAAVASGPEVAQRAASRARSLVASFAVFAPLLLLLPSLRTPLESRMAVHMLVLFPLLLACGWIAARRLGEPAWLRRLDGHGLLGAAVVSCVAAWWMLPVALDFSLVSAPLRWVRLGSWWLAGALLAGSWRRMGPEIAAFLLGNLAWMSATAGLLYQEAEQRLCVNYLIDEQLWTGRGLVLAALVLGAMACRRVLRSSADAAAAGLRRVEATSDAPGPNIVTPSPNP
jgi:hypothetical protein